MSEVSFTLCSDGDGVPTEVLRCHPWYSPSSETPSPPQRCIRSAIHPLGFTRGSADCNLPYNLARSKCAALRALLAKLLDFLVYCTFLLYELTRVSMGSVFYIFSGLALMSLVVRFRTGAGINLGRWHHVSVFRRWHTDLPRVLCQSGPYPLIYTFGF